MYNKRFNNMGAVAQMLAQQGRGGDTMLAHINPQEAQMLQEAGGSGTINPVTGLPEFFLRGVRNFFRNPPRAVRKSFNDDTYNYNPHTPVPQGNYNDFASPEASTATQVAPTRDPQALLKEGYRTLAEAKSQYGSMPAPIYPGANLAPKSALTQRAEQAALGYASRPAPYTRKLERVFARGNEGISPNTMQQMTNNLQGQQQAFGGNLRGGLETQFGNGFTPNIANFNGGIDNDAAGNMAESRDRFGAINQVAANLEGSRNNQTARILQQLQAGKQQRRQNYVNLTSDLGRQQQAHGNLINQANRNEFNIQAAEPQRRMDMLSRVLASKGGISDDTDPYLASIAEGDITRALQAFKATGGNNKYPGELVAPLPQEIINSQNIAGQINPRLAHSNSGQMRTLLRNVTGNGTIGERAAAAAPGAITGEVTGLNNEAQNTFGADLSAINNQFTRMGQYGSPAHIATAEARAREINKLAGAHRNRLTENSVRNQLEQQHGAQINDLGRLTNLGVQGNQEYNNIFSNLRTMNNIGANRWNSKQSENEELYRNYRNQAEAPWMQLGVGMGAGMGGGGNAPNALAGVSNNINLDNLNNLNTRYSALSESPLGAPTLNNSSQIENAMQQQPVQQQQQAQLQQNPTPRQWGSPQDLASLEQRRAEAARYEVAMRESLRRGQEDGARQREMQRRG